MNRIVPTLVPLACWLIGPVGAQGPANPIPVPQTQGMMTGLAFGFQTENSVPNQLEDPTLWMRSPGVQSGTLDQWDPLIYGNPGDGHPDYRAEALYRAWVEPMISTTANQTWDPVAEPRHMPRLGDMSTGGDVCPRVIPVGQQWRLDMTAQGGPTWYSLSFTTSGGNDGVQGGIIEQTRLNNPGLPLSAHVFSYTVEGSTWIDPQFEDTARIEYTRAQLGSSMGVTPTSELAITAIDWGMGDISVSNGAGPSRFQPDRNLFYFTLTDEWITDIQGIPGFSPPPFVLDPCFVYVMEWGEITTPGVWEWSEPQVAYTRAELLGANDPNPGGVVEIDGLSVYRGRGTSVDPDRTVFSLVYDNNLGGNNLDEILITQRTILPGSQPMYAATGVEAVTLRTQSGDSLSDKAGVDQTGTAGDPARVGGLCGRDPGGDASIADERQGTPISDAPGAIPGELVSEVGLSMQRILRQLPGGGQQDAVLLQVSGIEFPQHVICFVTYELQIYNATTSTIELTANSVPITIDPFALTADVIVDLAYAPSPDRLELHGRARISGFTLRGELQKNFAETWTSMIFLP